MIISHKKKFIFIHIYKTGGTSVTSVLMNHARVIEKISSLWVSRYFVSIVNRVLQMHDRGNAWINGLHKHAYASDVKEYLGSDRYNEYFKFCFVRNPFDWQVSLYHYVKSNVHRDNAIANKLSFKDFVIREIVNKAPLQTDFILEGEKVIVDYAGKIEDIQDITSILVEKLNLSDLCIPHVNKSKRSADFMSYYDDELKELVYEYYKRDFDLLGYDKH